MKKLIIIFMLAFLTLGGYADKLVSFNKITDVYGKILFNYQENNQYWAIAIIFYGNATSDEGDYGTRIYNVKKVGTGRDTLYTPKEVFVVLNNFSPSLASKYKQIYTDGISEDISL